jgi:hypothetical protein
MSQRQTTLLWMKDLLEQMNRSHEQLQWAADGQTETFLTEKMIGDLEEFQKLCQQLRGGRGRLAGC